MSRQGALAIATLCLAVLLFPAAAPAQLPPLTATVFFAPNSLPANLTFAPATPIKIILQIKNAIGADIITTDGFSATDFWRQLTFRLDGVGTITNAALATSHADTPFGTCHYRRNGSGAVVAINPAIQVVPVEVIPALSGLILGSPEIVAQFTFDDVRAHFDLSRDGHYTVTATIPVLTYTAGDIITDCDVEFADRLLLSFGAATAPFDIVSNGLEFFIDGTPPATTVSPSLAPNAAGWNNQNVTLNFTATDLGGSGVKDIVVTLSGAQAGTQTIAGGSGPVGVTAEGTTTVSYYAEDVAGNTETAKSQTVKLDKTPPVVTPPASITIVTEAGGARGSASPTLAAFLAGGTATDNLDPSPARLAPQVGGVNATNDTLFPIGTTTVAFRFQDVAGNIGSATSSVTVSGKPAISGAVVGSGAVTSTIRFYDLRFTNTGTGIARNVAVTSFSFPTVEGGSGADVSYDSSRSPQLPIALGDLAVGASGTIRVYLVVKHKVTRFSMTESGNLRDAAGTAVSFSTSQVVVIPRDD